MKKLICALILLVSLSACEEERSEHLYAVNLAKNLAVEIPGVEFEVLDETQHTEASATIGVYDYTPEEKKITIFTKNADSLTIKNAIFHELGHYVYFESNLDKFNTSIEEREVFAEAFAYSFSMDMESSFIKSEERYSKVKGVYNLRFKDINTHKYNKSKLKIYFEYVLSSQMYNNMKLAYEKY